MNNRIKLAGEEDREHLLAALREDSSRNVHVIEDFLRWPRRSKFYYIEDRKPLSFLHISGHPGHKEPVIILDGAPDAVKEIWNHVKPEPPFVVRETSSEFREIVTEYYPGAKVYLANRMNVDRAGFRSAHKGLARQLLESDLPALEQFYKNSPPQGALGLSMWLKGVQSFLGVFDQDRLVSVGSSMISLPEVWNLISVETLPEYRGRGYATEIMSGLTSRGLKEAPVVTLSVVQDNDVAIRVYERLGYKNVQKCMWVDCGAGATP